ncbi:MAG: HipA N-terminal domain-containing protein [Verrucomicrobiota bacterium]
MRKGIVKVSGRKAGLIEEVESGFRFSYDEGYLSCDESQPVSLTLPLREVAYESRHLFAFFSGLVAEGALQDLQCRMFQIDPDDVFGLLLATASSDVIGCVTVEAVEE